VPGGDLLGAQRRRAPARLAEAQLVERLGDLQADVEPDEVGQLERPHAEPGGAHDRVDVLDAGQALLQQPQRLQAERAVAAVDQEPGAVGRLDHAPAHRLAGRARGGQRLGGGLQAGDQLDERHQRRGVEEVQAHDPRRVGRPAGDRRDRDRGRVGRQHRAGRDLRQRAEQLVLELQALGRGLDDQRARGQRRERRGLLEPRADRGRVAVEAALVHQLGDAGPGALGPGGRGALDRVEEQRPGAALGGELRDPRSHRAGAHDADDLRCCAHVIAA
jgi:hypothetical protein